MTFKTATVVAIAALNAALWSTDLSAENPAGGFEIARRECGAITDFDELKRCVARVNGLVGGQETPALPANVLALLDSCQKSDSASYLQDCIRKLTLIVQAQNSARLAFGKAVGECSRQADDKLRQCIEELVTIAAIPEEMANRPVAATAAPGPKGWHLAPQAQSKIDGSRRVLLLLVADEKISSSTARDVWPTLAVRCNENVTSIVVSAPGNFVTGSVAVTYKIDKDKPVTQTWTSADSRDAIGLWNGGQAIPFIKSLLERQDLVVRYKPVRSTNIEMSFTVAGLDKVIEPIRTACKW